MQARLKPARCVASSKAADDRYDLDQQQVKVSLGRQVAEAIRVHGLGQLDAARSLGIDQPKISRLLRGQLDEFSTARLLRFLALLGNDVEIIVHLPSASRQRQVGRLRVIENETKT
jgi:predicted XRE-type DNA-binding protein